MTEIVQERILDATPEEVFAAWSDAESLRLWMCPGAIDRAEAEVDFRVGGAFRIVMRGGEEDFCQHGEYLEIDPPKRLVFTWVSEWVTDSEATTRVSVTLEPVSGGRTRLRLVHEGLPPTDTYAGHEQGWADILAKLAETLDPPSPEEKNP